MIKPINGHVLIEPVKHESFMASQKETYQEIGVVLDASWPEKDLPFKYGDRVYFDAWLGKKYPKEGSTTDYYWLIRLEDIVAYEQVPEQSV